MFKVSYLSFYRTKLDNRYRLKTDDFLKSTGKSTKKIKRGLLPFAFPYIISPLLTTTLTISRLEFCPQRKTLCKNPTPMQLNLYHDWLDTYREGFDMNTENKNPIIVDEDPSPTQSSMSSPLAFELVQQKITFFH